MLYFLTYYMLQLELLHIDKLYICNLFLQQAHLVAAFEQSLGNMTIRLKSLTLTAEQKVKTICNIFF